jgi:hypothetical protein
MYNVDGACTKTQQSISNKFIFSKCKEYNLFGAMKFINNS